LIDKLIPSGGVDLPTVVEGEDDEQGKANGSQQGEGDEAVEEDEVGTFGGRIFWLGHRHCRRKLRIIHI
jgi:hypothetical protein